MSLQYASRLPIDASGETMQEFLPAKAALSVSASDNNSVSSVITLTDNTTTVEVHAVGGAAVLKFITAGNTNASVISAAGTANFDVAIPANYFRRVVIPIETVPISSVVGANKQNGLYNRIAVKSVGIASVLTAQY